MTEFNYTIKDSLGIHARPAGLLVKTADTFDSEITISKDDKKADAKRIFSVMSIGIKCGDKIKITATGTDEEKAIAEMKKFFEENL